MPIYEYECTDCSHRFEVIQKFSDPPKRTCPKCRAKVRKLISAPGIQFKGSGWYITDYARKGSSTADSDASTDSSSDSEKSESSKAEASKPDTSKTEAKSAAKSTRAPRRARRRTSSKRRGRR